MCVQCKPDVYAMPCLSVHHQPQCIVCLTGVESHMTLSCCQKALQWPKSSHCVVFCHLVSQHDVSRSTKLDLSNPWRAMPSRLGQCSRVMQGHEAPLPRLLQLLLQFKLFLMHRLHHPEYTPFRPIRDVKLDWAWLVLGWVIARELQVLMCFYTFVTSRFWYPLLAASGSLRHRLSIVQLCHLVLQHDKSHSSSTKLSNPWRPAYLVQTFLFWTRAYRPILRKASRCCSAKNCSSIACQTLR